MALIQGCGYFEIHFIDAVGILDTPNVTKIANHLKVTRGAVSRMTKKQIAQNYVNPKINLVVSIAPLSVSGVPDKIEFIKTTIEPLFQKER